MVEQKGHPVLRFLGKFWGMSAWMLELIMILSAVLHNYSDLVVVSALLLLWFGWSRFGLATDSRALHTFSFLTLLYLAAFSIVSRGSGAGSGQPCRAGRSWRPKT